MKFLGLLLFILPFSLFSQYWKEIQFTEELEAAFEEDSSAANAGLQVLAYRFNGNSENALKAYDRYYPYPSLNASADSIVSNLSRVDIDSNWTKSIADQQILMFSNSFASAQSEMFLSNQLPELFRLGYRRIAVSGLNVDSLQGNVILHDSMGKMLRDFGFRQLIEKALSLGMTCYSYDSDEVDWKIRYTQQSQKVAQLVQEQFAEKMIILSDFRQLAKNQLDSSYQTIANALIEKLNINPFTIHQSYLEPRSSEHLEANILKELANSVVLMKDSVAFKGFNTQNLYDQILVHPKKLIVKQNGVSNTEIPKKRFIDYPAFLLVFNQDSYENDGFPIEMREILSEKDNTLFFLPKGAYTFLFLYKEREIFHTLKVIKTK